MMQGSNNYADNCKYSNAVMVFAQGRSQKWPKRGGGGLRPEIVKGGGFEDEEALRISARTSFYYSFGKNNQKIWANGGGF